MRRYLVPLMVLALLALAAVHTAAHGQEIVVSKAEPTIGQIIRWQREEDPVNQGVASAYISGAHHAAYHALAMELSELPRLSASAAANILNNKCRTSPLEAWQLTLKLAGARVLLYTDNAGGGIALAIRAYCKNQLEERTT